MAALRFPGRDDLLFQLFLGRDAISAGSNRGRFEEARSLRPRRSTRQTDLGFSRLYDDAAHICWRVFPDRDRGPADASAPEHACAANHRPIFWRHELAD